MTEFQTLAQEIVSHYRTRISHTVNPFMRVEHLQNMTKELEALKLAYKIFMPEEKADEIISSAGCLE